MSVWKIIIGVIVGLVVLFVIIGILVPSDDDETSSTASPRPTATSTPAPLVITVEDIYQAYQENEARANATYKKIKLDLHFRVDEVEDKYVIQELDGFLAQAQLRFDQDDLIPVQRGRHAERYM